MALADEQPECRERRVGKRRDKYCRVGDVAWLLGESFGPWLFYCIPIFLTQLIRNFLYI